MSTNGMKAKVVKGFMQRYSPRKVNPGEVLEVKDNRVYVDGNWICEVGSPFWDKHLMFHVEQ